MVGADVMGVKSDSAQLEKKERKKEKYETSEFLLSAFVLIYHTPTESLGLDRHNARIATHRDRRFHAGRGSDTRCGLVGPCNIFLLAGNADSSLAVRGWCVG